MADLSTRAYPTEFKGLLTDFYIALGVIGVSFTVFECARKRRRKVVPSSRETSEGYSMNGYLFSARCFVPFRPVPPLSKWPLAWIWDTLKLKQDDYLYHTSIDATAYVRVLRGCFYFTALQTFVLLPPLLTLHLHYSPDSFAATDINRASLSALVSDSKNVHLLWVHCVCLYFFTITWWGTIYWVGRGILDMRRQKLQELQVDMSAQTATDDPHRGWRYRTVVVTQIPPSMRSESGLVQYFTNGLKSPKTEADGPSSAEKPTADHPCPPGKAQSDPPKTDHLISEVVLVRRTAQLHDALRKREEALEGLEKAHVQLARNVLRAVRRHNQASQASAKDRKDIEKAPEGSQHLELLSATLTRFLPGAPPQGSGDSIWTALRSLPAESLDAYQPLTQLSSLFKGQTVPTTDFYLQKYNLYSHLVEELRSAPNETFSASPTAFITFATPADARRAIRLMPKHPDKTWSCLVSPGPDARDVVWDKAVIVSFGGDLLRNFLVEALCWLIIVFWLIPVSFLLAFVSITNLAKVWPSLSSYLEKHEATNSLLTSFVPTMILSVLLFLVPTILIQLSNRGQHFFLLSKLHNATLSRYWKFLATDVLILFCVGKAALESIFTDPGKLLAASSLVNRVASAFPAGAAFFTGYSILVTALNPGFELMLLGFPWINHISASLAKTPRKRLRWTLPRAINVYYWLPCHLLILAILFVFALLNPLVIAFVLVYFALSLVVFKRSFFWYYYTRCYQLNGVMIYVRFMRYSCDALMVGQVAIIALLFVSKVPKYGGAVIPTLVLTAFFKLAATRVFAAQTAILDVAEGEVVAGNARPLEEEVRINLMPHFLWRYKFFARMSYPMLVDPARHISKKSKLNGTFRAIATRTSTDSQDCQSPVSGKSETKEDLQSPRPTLDPLVVPHPKLVRDDRTDYSARYHNPAMTHPITHELWLPRDPTSSLDLNDTVDYRGFALVSSAAGNGRLGDWSQDQSASSGQKPGLGKAQEEPEVHPMASKERTVALEPSSPPRLTGQERIQVAEEVRQRVVSPSKTPPAVGDIAQSSEPKAVRRPSILSSSPPDAHLTRPPTTRRPSNSAGLRRTFSSMSRTSSSQASFSNVSTISQNEALRQEVLQELHMQPASQAVKDQQVAEAQDTNGDDHRRTSLFARLLERSADAWQ